MGDGEHRAERPRRGIEIVGALWLLLVSLAAIRTRTFPPGRAALGTAIGVAGTWTLLPAAAAGPAVLFGLGFMVWFVWAGGSLLRGSTPSWSPGADHCGVHLVDR